MAAKKTTNPVTPADNKSKALEAALTQIEKQFGKGAVMKLGEKTDTQIETYPTGALSLDLALGVGGILSTQRTSAWILTTYTS